MGLYCVRIISPKFRVDATTMNILAAISAIMVIFAMIPLFSASNEADNIVNVSWAYTKKGVGDALYIGVYSFAAVDGSSNKAFAWDSDNCDYLQSFYGEHFCNECEHGFTFIIGFTAVFFVFSVFTAVAAVLRAMRKPGLFSDIALQHAVIVCSLGSFIFGVTAVAVFARTCRRYWPFSVDEYEYGAASALIIFVVVVKFLEIIAHCLVTQEPLTHQSTLQDDPNNSGMPA